MQDGSVLITCEFRIEKPIQEALDEIRSAVNLARSDLPNDLLEPIVKKLDFTGGPVLAFTISSPLFDEEGLSWFVDQTVVRRLLSIKGVGAVNRVGGVQRQVDIALDPVRMQALQISAADVSRQLRQVQSESAGGRTDLGERRVTGGVDVGDHGSPFVGRARQRSPGELGHGAGASGR